MATLWGPLGPLPVERPYGVYQMHCIQGNCFSPCVATGATNTEVRVLRVGECKKKRRESLGTGGSPGLMAQVTALLLLYTIFYNQTLMG